MGVEKPAGTGTGTQPTDGKANVVSAKLGTGDDGKAPGATSGKLGDDGKAPTSGKLGDDGKGGVPGATSG